MIRRALTLGLILFGLALGAAAQTPQETKPRRAVVTFDGKLEALPPLAPGDFEIQAGKQKLAPTRLYGPDDLPTVLAIVLQENITSEFATQLPALRKFILNQPPNTYIGLFYLSAQSIQQPTRMDAPRQKIADAVRAPKAMKELAPPNPYEPLAVIMNFLYNMPDARKEILLFSEGTDALADTAAAGQNRNVRKALEMAHQTGIPVWVIYTRAIPPVARLQNIDESPLGSGSQIPGPSAPSAGPQDSTTAGQASAVERVFGGGAGGGGSFGGGSVSAGGTSFSGPPLAPRVQYGLTYLKYLSERSGGKMLSSGKFATDIAPYLDEFERLLRQQYVLEFSAQEPPKKIKVRRKIRGTKLRHPRR